MFDGEVVGKEDAGEVSASAIFAVGKAEGSMMTNVQLSLRGR